MSQEEPDFEALSGAVDGVRRLIAHLRKTQAPVELLEDVAREANALAERLRPYDHPGPYAQRALVMREGGHLRDTDVPAEYFPYSPIIGPLNPLAPPIEFRLEDGEIRAEHVFDAPWNGPPTAVHGGVIALVFDELLGACGALQDVGGFTGTLTIRYVSLTPIGRPIRMRAWIDGQDGRKIYIKGSMHCDGDDGETLCCEAEGIFIQPRVSILADALEKAHIELPSD